MAAAPAASAATDAWWTPLALRGTSLAGVAARGDTITVRSEAGVTLRSNDAGARFTRVSGDPPLPGGAAVIASGVRWSIDPSGRVLRATRGMAPAPDPLAPELGSGARLIAVTPSRPDAVVAVAVDGTVWRRGRNGQWGRSLLLLPAGLLRGVPAITALAAFDRPLTDTVYMATDGYSVLISSRTSVGWPGDDWIRAGPGLPDAVRGLAADSQRRTVYAATSDGLWAHRLQALPAVPVYASSGLLARWLGIALVVVTAAAFTLLAMLRIRS